MALFGRKKHIIPQTQSDQYELVLRCSICSGEQVLCMKDRKDGSMHELMVIQSFEELQKICKANHIDPETIRKIF